MELSTTIIVNAEGELILLVPGPTENSPVEEYKVLGLSQTELVGDNGYFEIK